MNAVRALLSSAAAPEPPPNLAELRAAVCCPLRANLAASRARKRVASTAVAAIPSRDDAVPAPASAPATGRPGKAVAVKRMADDRQPPTRVSRRKSVPTANAELSNAQEGMDLDEYR